MISHSWPMIFKKPASKCFRDQIIFNQDPPGAFFLSRLPSQEHKRKPYDLYTFFSHRRFTYYTSRRNTSHPLQIIPKSYFKAPFHIALKKKEKNNNKKSFIFVFALLFFKILPFWQVSCLFRLNNFDDTVSRRTRMTSSFSAEISSASLRENDRGPSALVTDLK